MMIPTKEKVIAGIQEHFGSNCRNYLESKFSIQQNSMLINLICFILFDRLAVNSIMSKIVYLLGAGASCKALPLNKEIPRAISDFIDDLKKETGDNQYFQGQIAAINAIIEDLNWMRKSAAEHASIDTFAKKLFLQEETRELDRLCHIFNFFFTALQSNIRPDFRYDAFFASILEDSYDRVPNDFTIITWNYDLQLELAYAGFMKSPELKQAQHILGCISKHDKLRNDETNFFKVIKLNGDVSIRSKTEKLFMHDFFKLAGKAVRYKELIRTWVFYKDFQTYHPNISFAWEPEYEQGSIVEQCIKRIAEAQVLVIIGYSFPFFNRKVDRQILQKMNRDATVYIQAPDADVLVERFNAIYDEPGMEVIPRFDENQFWIPLDF